MKKLYLFLLTIFIGGIAGYLVFLNTENEKLQLGESFTPKDFYEYEIQQKKLKKEAKADKPDEFTRHFKDITTKFDQEENQYPLNYRVVEFEKSKKNSKKYKKSTKFTPVWTQRGPANVGGRTRGLIVDPDDPTHNTWFAGAATGGVWKTTDGGNNWINLTDDFPNLSANTLAMAASNTQVIYAGTGESFPGGTYLKGNGIFKTTDKGENWTQLESTTNNDYFAYINRLIVDPSNENIVIAATEKGIMKSIDGGVEWDTVYTSTKGIEDIFANPDNFDIIYAAENSIGVIKSTDAGQTWTLSSEGLGAGQRYEIAVSPVDPDIIYASVNASSSESYVYRSIDAGANWLKFEDKDGDNMNYLGGQGEYDNIIQAHPFNKDIAFVGGVNLWKVDFSSPGTTEESDPTVTRVDLINTSSFLDFINFGGAFLGGGMDTSDITDPDYHLVEDDFVSVEIRFGPGLSQKAHRFTVGGEGSGVPLSGYFYEDYVEVPFEVWDVTNNVQLMASFRDQEEDGKFDLEARDDNDDTKGREYLFINSVEYSETESSEIATDAGHSYKQIYFFWPTLAAGGIWDENNLPESKISVVYGTVEQQIGTTYNVSDAYGQFTGNNRYDQGEGLGTTKIPGIHPDHHNLVMIPINEATDSFLIVNANDGGMGISFDSGETLEQLPNNYITTQFYGAAKKPGANEYIGGMQDNGTWRSQVGEDASSASDYLFQLGGDGFECMWHYTNGDKIIGSIYNNAFYRTLDGGINWYNGSTGIADDDGPFISRISSHKNAPDVLYAVGSKGIYKSTNFAESWSGIELPEGWNSTSYIERGITTSQHNVEVSLANENIVWAGAAMAADNGWKIFVSTDQGETFNSVNEFADADMSGYISGIATHPFEDSTAYILFSFANEPKVLRTEDLGQTWEDITGFVGSKSSTNGFPDVVTHSLVVLPNDPNTIWVGTDIGLFESNDNGNTWHYATDYEIPAVSVYDMFVKDDQVVLATHGRGIWTASIEELKNLPEIKANYSGFQTINTKVNLTNSPDSVEVYLNNNLEKIYYDFAEDLDTLSIEIDEDNIFKIKAISYFNGDWYQSLPATIEPDFAPAISVSKVADDNILRISSVFGEYYDSVKVYKDSELVSVSTDISEGVNTFDVNFSSSNTYELYIEAFLFGNNYQSNVVSKSATYTSINNKLKIESLKIYPNPTKGDLSVEIPDNIYHQVEVEVYSLSGAKVYTKTISQNDNRINIEHLNNGVYIVRMNEGGKVYSNKIQLRK